MKRRILLLVFACLACCSAWAYDFTAVAPSGQTLYYNITGSNEVAVTSQNDSYPYYSTYPTGTLTIPDTVSYSGTVYTVTSIGDYAFFFCSDLTSVNIPDGVISIGYRSFLGCISLTSVTIGAGVTSIGGFAFSACSALSSVAIPDAVTTIGSSAFLDCSEMTSVTIGNGVTTIDESAFEGCSSLSSITIPHSVTSIGNWAFSECSGLTEIKSFAENATSVGTGAFNGINSTIPVYIPCGSQSAYNSLWYYFSNFIEVNNFIFNAQSADETMGNVVVLQIEVTCESPKAIVYANAQSGFKFDYWSDGNVDNPRTLTLTSDSSITAYFKTTAYDTIYVHDTIYVNDTVVVHDTIYITTEGVDDVETCLAKVYCSQGQIVVEGAEGYDVTLYDAVGRCLAARRDDFATLRFDVPASGAYLVKVGHAPARRVVVIK